MLINSVTGAIDTKNMGVTLMHEHVANLEFSFCHAYDDWFDKETTLAQFKDEIDRVKPYGVSTFVDCTPINLGRDLDIMIDASEKAEIPILASTGLYYMEDPWTYFDLDPGYLAELLLRDTTKGIQGRGVKPAVIKCATDSNVGYTEVNKKMLQAAAITARDSGLPIYTHTTPDGKMGLYQQEVFAENGVKPEKVVIGHSFDTCDIPYLEKMLANGTYIGCDRVGLQIICSTDKLATCVAELVKKGYASQIMLSHDSNITSDFALSFVRYKRDRKQNPAVGAYFEVFEVLIPMLKEQGVTQEQIDEMTITNPRRFFEGLPIGAEV